MHRTLLASPMRTTNPLEASLFFVPWYMACHVHVTGLIEATWAADELTTLLIRDYPWWNRTAGRDHLLVTSHDTGSCKLLREVPPPPTDDQQTTDVSSCNRATSPRRRTRRAGRRTRSMCTRTATSATPSS